MQWKYLMNWWSLKSVLWLPMWKLWLSSVFRCVTSWMFYLQCVKFMALISFCKGGKWKSLMSGCNTLPKWLGILAYFTGFNILLIVNPLWKISFWFYFCLLSKFYSPLFWDMAMHVWKQLWNNRKWNLNHGWIIEPQQLYFNFLDMQNFLQIASNSSLGDNLRIKALHFVSWLARIKPKVG